MERQDPIQSTTEEKPVTETPVERPKEEPTQPTTEQPKTERRFKPSF